MLVNFNVTFGGRTARIPLLAGPPNAFRGGRLLRCSAAHVLCRTIALLLKCSTLLLLCFAASRLPLECSAVQVICRTTALLPKCFAAAGCPGGGSLQMVCSPLLLRCCTVALLLRGGTE